MKKKLALLLAVVMLIGIALPTNVSALTNNERRGNALRYYDEGTVMIDLRVGQQYFTGNSGRLSPSAKGAIEDSVISGTFGIDASDFLANDGAGIDFTMQVTDVTDKTGLDSQISNNGYYEFEARLVNGYWSHINTGSADAILYNDKTSTGWKNTYGHYLQPVRDISYATGSATYLNDTATGWKQTLATTGSRAELGSTGSTGKAGGDMLAIGYDEEPDPAVVVEEATKEGLQAVIDVISSLKGDDYENWYLYDDGNTDDSEGGLLNVFINAVHNFIWQKDTKGFVNWPFQSYHNNTWWEAEAYAMQDVAIEIYRDLFRLYRGSGTSAVTGNDYNDVVNLYNAFNMGPATVTQIIRDLSAFGDDAEIIPNDGKATYLFRNRPLVITDDFIAAYKAVYADVTSRTAIEKLMTTTNMVDADTLRGLEAGNDIGDAYEYYAYYDATMGSSDSWTEKFNTPADGTNGIVNNILAGQLVALKESVLAAIQITENADKNANAAQIKNLKDFFANINGFSTWTANTTHGTKGNKRDWIVNDKAEHDAAYYPWGLFNQRWIQEEKKREEFLFRAPATPGTDGDLIVGNDYYSNVTELARLKSGNNNAYAIPYIMYVQTKDPSVAIIRIAKDDLKLIAKDDILLIPMDIITIDPDEDVSLVIHSQSNLFRSGTYQIGTSTGGAVGTTKTVFKTIVNAAKGRVYLGTLRIDEVSPNTLKDGFLVLIPPKGYNMVNNAVVTNNSTPFSYIFGSNARVTVTGYYTITPTTSNSDQSDKRQCMILEFSDLATNRQSAGYVEISGLSMTPLDNNPELISNYGDKLNILIRDISSKSYWNANTFGSNSAYFVGWCANNYYSDPSAVKIYSRDDVEWTIGTAPVANVYPQTLEAAYREYWNIDYFAADPVTKFSGLTDQITAKVTVKELVLDSWATEKETIFTVCDADGKELPDVKITRVGIRQTNLRQVGGGNFAGEINGGSVTSKWNYDINGKKTDTQLKQLNCAFSVASHQFFVSDLYKNTNSSYRTMELTFYLSAQANFEGDVYIKMSGSAIADNIYSEVNNNAIVQVASFVPPVVVTTESSEVQVGFQKYAVSDVTITENMINGVGSIENGKKLQIALGEYGTGRLTSYMYFAPLTKADISLGSDPNFNISEPIQTTWTANSAYGWNQRVIEFTVLRKSKNVAGEINITNLNLNVDRTPPQGNYDLLIGGDAIVNNGLPYNESYTFMYDRFDVWGVVEPDYLVIKTQGANVQEQNKVELTAGTNIIRVNGVEQEMEVPCLLVDDRFYVPLRFAAVALNVPDGNISFDDGSRKALIINGDKTVAFQQNSSAYWINGIELSMVENGVEAIAFIENDRMYIPVRFLAYGLNVPVDYDPETHVAILNGAK